MQLAYLLKMTIYKSIFFAFSKIPQTLSLQIHELNPTGIYCHNPFTSVNYIHYTQSILASFHRPQVKITVSFYNAMLLTHQ